MADSKSVDEIFSPYLCLAFKDIYGDVEKPILKDLLDGIPTKVIIEVISHFMALIHINERDFQKQIEILNIWIGRFPLQDIDQLNTAVENALYRAKGKVLIFNNISSLFFLEVALSHYCEGEPRDLTPDEELRLFKAYILVTQQWTELQVSFLKHKKVKTDQEALEFILPFQIPFFEVQSFKDFRWQLIKAIYFFKFLEQNNELGKHLNDFLKKYHAKDWFEFLSHILNGYSILSKSGNKASIISIEKQFIAFKEFLNQLAVDIKTFSIKEDFLSLREKPVFKMNEDSYAFFNFNFLIDKLFQSIQFDFAQLLQEKGVVANFGDFKSRYYSKEFSERYMLYQLLEYLVGKRNCKKYNGDELAKELGEEGPDYYIRFGSKIFVIEFKDVLLAAKAKMSYDFSILKEDIFKKLVENEKGKAKGVSQLFNFISRLGKDGFVFDKFDATQARIYPILIVTDSAYNSFGINWELNIEFKKMLSTTAQQARINDLIVVDLDTLIKYQDPIHDRKIVCADTFDKYIAFTKQSTNPFNKFLSYSQFLPDHLKVKLGTNPPPRFLQKEFIGKLPIG